MKRLPIKLAKDVLEAYGLKQVIVLCKDNDGNDHFITYGADKEQCKEAGISADRWKKVFGWPDHSLSKYTDEIREEENARSIQIIERRIDYHHVSETMADAMDMGGCVKHHEKYRKELEEVLKVLRARGTGEEWLNDE
jgi:hypothetical protein